jgi:serine-type D-Ala-D-Ala carboxypeptidase
VSTRIQNSVPTLVPAFDRQDEVFSSAFSIVREAIRDHVFPAASIAVTRAGRLVALKAFGNFVYDEEFGNALSERSVRRNTDINSHAEVTPATLFDLASVTKVVATSTMAMILYERGLLDLDATIVGTIPEFLVDSCGEIDPRRRDVTFRMLLAHSSGLPAYEKLFLQAHSRDELQRSNALPESRSILSANTKSLARSR